MAKLWFAWIANPDVPFSAAAHARLDEADFTLDDWTHDEGKPAAITFTIKNPGVGLLAPGRAGFFYLSESPDDVKANATPLVKGRVVGIPTELGLPRVTIEAVAGPEDLQQRMRDFMAARHGLPLDEPLVDRGNDDPETALHPRSAFFYIDPLTWDLSLSDVLEGDRVVPVGRNHSLKGFKWRFLEPPIASITQDVTVEFEQACSGPCDVGPYVGALETYGTTDQPVELVGLEPGWTVRADRAKTETLSTRRMPTGEVVRRSYVVMDRGAVVTFPDGRKFHAYVPSTETYDVDVVLEADVPRQRITPQILRLDYAYAQPRRETIRVTTRIGVQPVGGTIQNLVDQPIGTLDPTIDYDTPDWYPGRATITGEYVLYDNKRWRCTADNANAYFYFDAYLNGVLYSRTTPGFAQVVSAAALPDRRLPSFSTSARAQALIEHVELGQRATLRFRLRCIQTLLKMSWARTRGLTLRDNLSASRPGLPDYEGKITSIRRFWTGKGWGASVTVGSAVGDGSGMDVPLGADVSYTTQGGLPVVPVNAFALGAPAYSVVKITDSNLADDQVLALNAADDSDQHLVVPQNPSTKVIQMRTLPTADVLSCAMNVQALVRRSPKQFDLAA